MERGVRESRALVFAGFVFWFGLAAVGWVAVSGESWSDPPGSMGDDVYFENIGWNLANERGFYHDFRDEAWRDPFERRRDAPRFQWVLYLQHQGPTTSRAPGYPMFIAGVYSLFDRDFQAVRIVQTVLLVAAAAWLGTIIFRDWGWVAAGLFGLFLGGDYFVWRTCGQLMSEAVGTAGLMLLVIAAREVMRAGADSWQKWAFSWLAIGALFGVVALVRANLNAWLLLFCAGATGWLVWRRLRRRPVARWSAACSAFLIGAIVVSAPWWIRNCRVTDGFAPFGTSGSFGLVGGYCDQAYRDFGNWSLERSLECQQQAIQQPGFDKKTLAQQEYAMGKLSVQLARQWAVENWQRLPTLMAMKAISHLGFYRRPAGLMVINALLLFGFAFGVWADRDGLGRWMALALALSLVTTMLTWPHYGRYSLPLRPLIHAGAAIGTVWFWSNVFRRMNRSGHNQIDVGQDRA